MTICMNWNYYFETKMCVIKLTHSMCTEICVLHCLTSIAFYGSAHFLSQHFEINCLELFWFVFPRSLVILDSFGSVCVCVGMDCVG